MAAVCPTSPKQDSLKTPLLNQTSGQASGEGRAQSRLARRVFGCLGVRSGEELSKVVSFLLAAFLANAFFVIGRNIGTVLFLAALGSEHLTSAIFISGMGTVVAGQVFSSLSRGRSTTLVNGWMLSSATGAILFLYVAVVNLPEKASEASDVQRPAVFLLYYAVYIAQDVFSNFVAMQCASVAQSAFSVPDAKRLFGKVQLGNSLAAMSIGVCIGSIAKLVGTGRLLLVQVAVLLLSLLLNARIGRLYVNAGAGKKKKKALLPGAPAEKAEPWWKNLLILAMGLWGFTVIFTKTMYEYEYNVLVANMMSAAEMVTLTGYLYAGAGFCSTAINLLGTNFCLDHLGMRGAILATPACLLSVSLAILLAPSVETTFCGRLVDLSLRWSLNNTVRTVLWIAVPSHQAVTAKPWVEGTIKKMGQAFNAVVISLVLLVSGGSLAPLSFLSLAFSSLLFACCVRVYRLYLESMWTRIKRRELKHQLLEQLPDDKNISNVYVEKLLHGGTVAQIDTLLQIGEGLSDSDWEGFFSRFHELPPTVQLKVIELGRRQHHRVKDDFLINLIAGSLVEPAVLEIAILATGERSIFQALEPLEAHLDSPWPNVRAAAAVSVLRIGWGVGLGAVSSAAMLVLEQMLDFPLVGQLRPQEADASGRRGSFVSSAVLARRGSKQRLAAPEPTLEELEALAPQLEQEWEAAIDAGNMGHAAALALQLTHVKAALNAQRKRARTLSASPMLKPSLSPDQRPLQRLTSGQEEEVAVALQMVQLLPEPRTLVPYDTWLRLLDHSSDQVRAAAVGYVQEEDARYPEVLQSLVRCLESSTTYNAAETALHKLNRPSRVQEAVLARLTSSLELHRQEISRLSLGLEELPSMSHALNMIQHLKFLKRQSQWAGPDLPVLQASGLCDKLLNCSIELSDPDVKQELYQTAVDLKDQGFEVTKELAESRLREVALQMCKGLAVQKWMGYCCSRLSTSQLAVLERFLELPGPRGSTGESAGPSEEDGDELGEKQDAKAIFLKIAQGYVDEQIYLDRLQLLQLAFLAAPRMPFHYRSTRVLAAWRLLRDQNATSEAAVLELLDSMLPVTLKSIVVPLLDRSPLEKRLTVGSMLSPEMREVLEPTTGLVPLSSPPRWTDEWFRSTGSVLGAQLSETLLHVAGDGAKAPIDAVPASVARTLLPKMALLSNVGLYAGLLSIHLAEVALVAAIQHVSQGARLCQMGETYVIVRGTFESVAGDQVFRRGTVVQEFHSICKELPLSQVECTSPGGGTVLTIRRQPLFDLMVRLTPKFALGLLKSLVQTLPAPSQTGGTKVVATVEVRTARFSTAEVDAMLEIQAGPKVASVPEELGAEAPHNESPAGLYFRKRSGTTEDMALLVKQVEQAQTSGSGQEGDEDKSRLSLATLDEDHPGEAGQEHGYIAVHQHDHHQLGADRGESFSLLEKVVLLQGVKMFRHVPLEHLPSIAMTCVPVFQERNSIVCRQGESTSATLFVVADGALGLFKADGGLSPSSHKRSFQRFGTLGGFVVEHKEEEFGTMLRKLEASDTMGNTALLCDTEWPYTAKALEDTWLLSINRRDLTDLLRGRREMASAVIRGLYKTFTRRIQQLESSCVVRRDTACW